jgi:hypothetical protein
VRLLVTPFLGECGATGGQSDNSNKAHCSFHSVPLCA